MRGEPPGSSCSSKEVHTPAFLSQILILNSLPDEKQGVPYLCSLIEKALRVQDLTKACMICNMKEMEGAKLRCAGWCCWSARGRRWRELSLHVVAHAADLQGEGDGGSQACMWWLMLLICKGKEMEGAKPACGGSCCWSVMGRRDGGNQACTWLHEQQQSLKPLKWQSYLNILIVKWNICQQFTKQCFATVSQNRYTLHGKNWHSSKSCEVENFCRSVWPFHSKIPCETLQEMAVIQFFHYFISLVHHHEANNFCVHLCSYCSTFCCKNVNPQLEILFLFVCKKLKQFSSNFFFLL